MLTRHDTWGFAATSAPEGFDLYDFEEAGLRVVERRFGPKDTIGVRLTHQDLANMIAASREAVSKVMSGLRRGGVTETRSRRITNLDREALSRYASGPSGLAVSGRLRI
jgi:CRP-like cAMP-binding protein